MKQKVNILPLVVIIGGLLILAYLLFPTNDKTVAPDNPESYEVMFSKDKLYTSTLITSDQSPWIRNEGTKSQEVMLLSDKGNLLEQTEVDAGETYTFSNYDLTIYIF